MQTPGNRWARVRADYLEVPVLVAVPAVLGLCAWVQIDQSALLTAMAAVVCLALLLLGFDRTRPALRQVMPVVVLAALASAGRVLFAPLPDVKPVSALCILAGVVFGRRCGFWWGLLPRSFPTSSSGKGRGRPGRCMHGG